MPVFLFVGLFTFPFIVLSNGHHSISIDHHDTRYHQWYLVWPENMTVHPSIPWSQVSCCMAPCYSLATRGCICGCGSWKIYWSVNHVKSIFAKIMIRLLHHIRLVWFFFFFFYFWKIIHVQGWWIMHVRCSPLARIIGTFGRYLPRQSNNMWGRIGRVWHQSLQFKYWLR